MGTITFLFEIIGTIAFAISGCIVGIKQNTDIFGVLALGIITSTGGGVIRDLILGITPPASFTNPVYVLTACITSLILFLYAYLKEKTGRAITIVGYRNLLLIADSLGLGVFTVLGVHAAITLYGTDNAFLCIFSGLITGVGGGLLRDMMVDQLPDIFRKHVYAVASLLGATLCLFMYREGYVLLSKQMGAIVIIAIRFLAAYYKWDLPKIHKISETE